jgi:hypothetical protein
MPANLSGLALREAIATKLCGWSHCAGGGWVRGSEWRAELPAYELEWEPAGEVVEKMREKGYRFIACCWDKDGSNQCHVEYELRSKSPGAPIDGEANEATMPLAICRAAIAALEARP